MSDKNKGPEPVKVFESWAKTYDESIIKLLKRNNFGVDYNQIVMRVVELADVKPGDKVLDIATGTGTIAISLANRADNKCKIIGIDITEMMLTKARENVKKFGLEGVIDFMRVSAEELPFDDGDFDVVTSSLAIHHMNVKKVLAEMVRVLKLGGRLAIADVAANPRWRTPIGKIYRYLDHLEMSRMISENVSGDLSAEFYTEEEWTRFLQGYKLRDIYITCTNPKHMWNRCIIILGGRK